MEAIILAAGKGTRMYPFTEARPKVMLPVAGRPVIEHVVRAAKDAGVTHARIIVHWHREQVEAHLGDGSQYGLKLTYHDQGEPRGTGHAVAAAGKTPDAPFFILSGDTLIEAEDLRRLRARVEGEPEAGVMGTVQVSDPERFGALEADGDRLVRIHEKSSSPPSDRINTGVYLMPPALFPILQAVEPSPRGEIELTDAVQHLATNGIVYVEELETWRDVGRPWDLLTHNEALLDARMGDTSFWVHDGKLEPGVHLHGDVRIEAGAHIKSGTYIEGPVVIGAGAVIGPHAYLRGRTVVGQNCKVGAHTEIKNSILFDQAKVPHLSYVGDSILGTDVNLGAGTKVANLRHDKANIHTYDQDGQKVDTGRHKFGVLLGDGTKTGINCSLNVGLVTGPRALLAPGKAYHGHLAGDTTHGLDQ